MAGYFQEPVTLTIVSDGAGAGNGSVIVNVPFRAGWLNQVSVVKKTGDSTDFLVNVHEEDIANVPFTVEDNQYLVHSVATGARTEYIARDLFKFHVAQAKSGSANTVYRPNTALTVYVAYTGATPASTVVFDVVLGGIGLS